MLVLETEESALKRGATIYSELAGYGATSGAYHSVAPEPNGEDAVRSMNEALNDAKLTTNDVDYINAHGTATEHNDLSETKAIKELFENNAYRIPVSSIKGSIGHLIGAAGAVEAAITALSLSQGIITPTLNYETPDPNCDLDYVPNIARKTPLKVALSNSFGFGNNNASLVLKKHESLKKI
jgi:3-oxoacyl-(acyl-carrier-protein) synthase